jgi:hypothetical protein
MMHLDQDPLDESSASRFRLVLREADDKFFRDNVMSSFLPQPFFFDGISTTQKSVSVAGDSSPASGLPLSPTDQALPVECEAHWRLYRNASFLKAHLRRLVSEENVNLQDFMFHCLRSCYLVVMTARDEASSFSIFSTLNSRGVDLTEVDKLKADLFKALEVNERTQASQSWAEMENLLGRSQVRGEMEREGEVQTQTRH